MRMVVQLNSAAEQVSQQNEVYRVKLLNHDLRQ
jgi:hypothetical protein